ncbi:hypothetical protein THOM_1622 [Trachipleistophora hominis]|uniref:LRR containing protein n=1 Tax=Trachipleistophora hominis TaxID=72359 RepID=L7JVB3_TRAHO|nr:hypothetical protein THOM_1622 [Trachipleistophora hominis]
MFWFSNFLSVFQLFLKISGILTNESERGAHTSGHYTEVQDYLVTSTAQKSHNERIKMMKRILESKTIINSKELEKTNELSTSPSKYLEDERLVYETKDYDFYFSSQRVNSTEPSGGLVIFIRDETISDAKYIFENTKNLYLTIYIHVERAKVLDFCSFESIFHCITGLCIEYHGSIEAGKLLSVEYVIPNLNFDEFNQLKTLKLINMLIPGKLLKELAEDTQMENLNFKNCHFYSNEYTAEQSLVLNVEFNKLYKIICFDMCKDDMARGKPILRSQRYYDQINVSVQKCENLCKLHLNTPDYVRIVCNEKNLYRLQELSLYIIGGEPSFMFSPGLSAKLKYLSIIIRKENIEAYQTLMMIDRSEIEHLVLIYSTDEPCLYLSEIFGLSFDALETLKIEASNYNLDLCKIDCNLSMRNVKALIIHCWTIKSGFIRVVNRLESLRTFNVKLSSDSYKNCKRFLRELNLKHSLEKLFIDLVIPIEKIEKSLMSFKNLQLFGTKNIFGCRPAKKPNHRNRTNIISSVKPSPHPIKNECIRILPCKILHLRMFLFSSIVYYEESDVWKAFAEVEVIIIEGYELAEFNTYLTEEDFIKQLPMILRSFDQLDNIVFQKYRYLKTLIIDCENENRSRKLIDELSRMYTKKSRTFFKYYYWVKKYNEERIFLKIRRCTTRLSQGVSR